MLGGLIRVKDLVLVMHGRAHPAMKKTGFGPASA
jgi:hypothetical protein